MKKTFSILLALALALSVSLVAAVPAAAQDPATLDVSKWTEYAENPIFGQGVDSGPKAYYPSVLYDVNEFSGHGHSAKYKMWYGTSGAQTALATSGDGINWTDQGVVMTNGYHAVVEYYPDGFTGANSGDNPSSATMYYRMWYWDGPGMLYVEPVEPEPIRYAESPDGFNWFNDQAITGNLFTGVPLWGEWNRTSYGPIDVLYNPTATNTGPNPFDYSFVMYFDATDLNFEEIGLGYSSDGRNWNLYGKVLPRGNDGPHGNTDDWDSCYASFGTVIKEAGGKWHMWYSGGTSGVNHGIGHATSTDGLTWTRDANNPIFHKDDGVSWRAERSYCPMVIEVDGVYKMWFSGKDASGNYALGYATNTNPDPDYVTIQAAIDAADPYDTISVAAGTYDESGLKINKSLTISGTGTVTITGTKGAFDSDLKFHGSYAPGTAVMGSMDYVVGVYNSADVDFVNVTIDGANSLSEAASDQYFAGVAFYNAQGSFSGCEIKGTASNPESCDGAAVSIYIDTDSGTWELEVSNCTFNTWPKNAISAYGSGTTLSNVLTVDVDDSTFTGNDGVGPSDGFQNGVVGLGGLDMEVDSCTFSAISPTAGSYWAAPVIAGYAYKDDPTRYAPAHDLTMNDCTFSVTGDKYVRRSGGVWITTTGTAVVEDCTFTNIKGILVDGSNSCDGDPGQFNPSSQDVTIRNCTFNGPSYPASVSYYMCGVNIQRGAQPDIENCTFSGFHDDDNSDGDGVCFCSAHFDPAYYTGSTGGSVTGCTFSDCVLGVYSGTDVTPLAINFNNFDGSNTYGVWNNDATPDEITAENNWWGDASGPEDPQDEGGETAEVPPCNSVTGAAMMNVDGTGDKVHGNVDYCPWLTLPYGQIATATGSGTASFSSDNGMLEELAAVATPPGAPVLPDGMFSFEVCCIDPGDTVILTITLPGPVLPVGSAKWWKYQAGAWYSLPIGSDDGDNIITITLTDGVFPGDEDSIPGQITDPGGLGYLVAACRLDISSTEGGSVTTPGEGTYTRYCGTVVSLVATAATGYHFVNWTGDVGTIADVHDASTTITMWGWYSITANFETGEIPLGEEYTLTISSTGGGSVTSPGEGTYAYEAGTVVNLVASPDDGFEFVNWTGDGITHRDSATTTVTMNGDYSIKTSFDFEETTTTGSAEGPSGSLGCFIATAAYGTPTAEQIDVLREFRDVVLLESAAGSQFVALYYQLSPPIADFIAGNELLRTLVRELLVDPIVWVVEATGAIWRN